MLLICLESMGMLLYSHGYVAWLSNKTKQNKKNLWSFSIGLLKYSFSRSTHGFSKCNPSFVYMLAKMPTGFWFHIYIQYVEKRLNIFQTVIKLLVSFCGLTVHLSVMSYGGCTLPRYVRTVKCLIQQTGPFRARTGKDETLPNVNRSLSSGPGHFVLSGAIRVMLGSCVCCYLFSFWDG